MYGRLAIIISAGPQTLAHQQISLPLIPISELCWHIRKTEYSDLLFRSEYIRIFGRLTEYISWVKASIERVVQPILIFWDIIFIQTILYIHSVSCTKANRTVLHTGLAPPAHVWWSWDRSAVAARFFQCRQACCCRVRLYHTRVPQRCRRVRDDWVCPNMPNIRR